MKFIYYRRKNKWLFCCFTLLLLLFYFGAFIHLLEKDYDTSFSYPYAGDIRNFVENLKNNEAPLVPPINIYNYSFVSNCKKKCETADNENIRVVYIVKSALEHFERRKAIRQSWGFEKRFSDVHIRTVFVLGVEKEITELQNKVYRENQDFGDIIQANFVDSYFNNTIKTIIGLSWAVKYCTKAKFYFFSDDDMYVSTKNVLRFIRNPAHYPEYLETPVVSLRRREKREHSFEINHTSEGRNSNTERRLNQVLDFELEDGVILFSGYVFVSSPQRHLSSKWYVSLSEYPYDKWPPYVTAGAYILSHDALVDMYYGSFYTKHFRFDDIYLGIIAKKLGIEPLHCSEFHFYKKNYNIYSYHYVIASHGYSNPAELLSVWNEQRSAGNA